MAKQKQNGKQSETEYAQAKGAMSIELDRIDADPKFNISRQYIDEEARKADLESKEQKELTQLIRTQQLLVPLQVSQAGNRYRLICGFRRFHALKTIGRKEANCVIVSGDEKQLAIFNVIENTARKNVTPYQLSCAASKLRSDYKMKDEEISRKLGKGREYINSLINFQKLPEPILREWSRFPSDNPSTATDQLRKYLNLKDAKTMTNEFNAIKYKVANPGVSMDQAYKAINVPAPKGKAGNGPTPPNSKRGASGKTLSGLKTKLLAIKHFPDEVEDDERFFYRDGAVALINYLQSNAKQPRIIAGPENLIIFPFDQEDKAEA